MAGMTRKNTHCMQETLHHSMCLCSPTCLRYLQILMNTVLLSGSRVLQQQSGHKSLYCIFYDTLEDENPFSSAYTPCQEVLSDIYL